MCVCITEPADARRNDLPAHPEMRAKTACGVCVCVCEREKERARARERERESIPPTYFPIAHQHTLSQAAHQHQQNRTCHRAARLLCCAHVHRQCGRVLACTSAHLKSTTKRTMMFCAVAYEVSASLGPEEKNSSHVTDYTPTFCKRACGNSTRGVGAADREMGRLHPMPHEALRAPPWLLTFPVRAFSSHQRGGEGEPPPKGQIFLQGRHACRISNKGNPIIINTPPPPSPHDDDNDQ